MLIKNSLQLQYLIQEFCKRIKLPFTGCEEDFQLAEVDIEGKNYYQKHNFLFLKLYLFIYLFI